MKIIKKLSRFISNETTLKVLVVLLALTCISYIVITEYHRTINDVITLIQSDNYNTPDPSFLVESLN
jgi:hypothetical protein